MDTNINKMNKEIILYMIIMGWTILAWEITKLTWRLTFGKKSCQKQEKK